MPKVLCTLPNASEDIGGIKFEKHANGMLSEDVSDEQAARLASIPGYELVGSPSKPAPTDADSYAEKTALLARAEAVKLTVKGNWGLERLKTEVEAAEKEDAEAKAKAAAGGAA